MGRRSRKHGFLPELEQGDVVPIDGKSNMFALHLKSAPDLLIKGELDLRATHGHAADVGAQLLTNAINHHQLRDTRFAAIRIQASAGWQDPHKRSELSKRMDACVREALRESVLLTLKRIKNVSARFTDDFTCLLLLHMEENGLLQAPIGARKQIARTYVRELIRTSKAEMDLSRLARKRRFTKVWRRMVFPVYEQARKDFRMLRKERQGLNNRRSYTDFRRTWAARKDQFAKYGLLLDRLETSSTGLALEYVQLAFGCDAEPEAIYEQMKMAQREHDQSSAELALSDALDQLM